MNRKATGIILSIAALALTAGIFCRPSVQPMSPERHAPKTPVASPLPSPEFSRIDAGAPERLALSGKAEESRTANAHAPTTPDAQVAPAPDSADRRFHPGERVSDAKITARYGDAGLTTDHPDVAAAIRIQERHPELMAHPAVVGTAVGLNDEGQIALIVYTKVDAAEIPRTIEGLPVAVWRSGEFFARLQDVDARAKGGGSSPPPTPSVDPTARFVRPVPIGVSTGHPLITAGTIGCRVKNAGGVRFALSNNHVYANENSASPGDNALQPGPYDGAGYLAPYSPADIIGTLSDFESIAWKSLDPLAPVPLNSIDAALVATTKEILSRSTPSDGYGPPSPTLATSIKARLAVMKYGRTTGKTSGKVQALNGTVDVGYDAGVARFVGQIIISPGSFSGGGDSGSLIVTQSEKRPVGLLFAGSSSVTIANPIGAVLTRFQVTIDENDN